MNTPNQRTAAASWKFKVLHGDSFRRFPKTYYVRAPTPTGLKQTIIYTLKRLPFYGQNVIAMFWAPTKTGTNSILLTTTYQPSVIYGNNKALALYHEAFLQQKYYIDRKNQVSFGLPGRVFLTCTPEQTQIVHRYTKNQGPPGRHDLFSRTWGSFVVPVIVGGGCVGVLEFVTDKLKRSYDNDITIVRATLENAGLQTSIKIERPYQNVNLRNSIQTEHPKTTNTDCQKRVCRTWSSRCTKYRRLVPLFGHRRRVAAEYLKLNKGTLKNVCKDVGIYEWPWISEATTRASSARKTQTDLKASSDTSSFGTSDASDDIANLSELIENINADFPEWSTVKTWTVRAPSAPDASDDISNLSQLNENIKADFPEWSYEQTTNARTSPTETKNYHVALDEDWIDKERQRPDFMQEFNELINQGNEDPGMEDIDMVDAFNVIWL